MTSETPDCRIHHPWTLWHSEVGPCCVVEVLDFAALARLHVAQRELAHRVVVSRHGAVE